jgi:hypothetical protein
LNKCNEEFEGDWFKLLSVCQTRYLERLSRRKETKLSAFFVKGTQEQLTSQYNVNLKNLPAVET